MITPASGRTPRGVRGLKCGAGGPEVRRSKSHPSRGAWIEIINHVPAAWHPHGRTPRGVRGLKSIKEVHLWEVRRRTPRGVRGLKYKTIMGEGLPPKVAPLAGCVD